MEAFLHRANEHSDPRLALLWKELGAEGYGIFQVLKEIMRSAGGQLRLDSLDELAYQKRLPEEKLASVVSVLLHEKSRGVFESDGALFWCPELQDGIRKYNDVVEKRRNAGFESARKRYGEQSVPPRDNKSSTDSQPDPNTCSTSATETPNTCSRESEQAFNTPNSKDTLSLRSDLDLKEGVQGEIPTLAAADRDKLVKQFSQGCIRYYVDERVYALAIEEGRVRRPDDFVAGLTSFIIRDRSHGWNWFAKANESARRQPPQFKPDPRGAVPKQISKVVSDALTKKPKEVL